MQIEGCAMVFDTVGTLVSFRGEEPVGIRQGLRELLEGYHRSGNQNFITSTESGVGVMGSVVYETGVRDFVRDCLIVSDRRVPGKFYQRVADKIGFTPEQAMQRMIVAGDDDFDAPNDLANVVLLLQRDGHKYAAEVHRLVTSRLYDAGRGDFFAGFLKLNGRSLQGIWGNTVEIGDGLSLALEIRDPVYPLRPGIKNPVVRIVNQDERWRRDLDIPTTNPHH